MIYDNMVCVSYTNNIGTCATGVPGGNRPDLASFCTNRWTLIGAVSPMRYSEEQRAAFESGYRAAIQDALVMAGAF